MAFPKKIDAPNSFKYLPASSEAGRCWRRFIRFGFLCGFLSMSAFAENEPDAQLKELERARVTAIQVASQPLDKLRDAYIAAINRRKNAAQSDGNLDVVLAANQEILHLDQRENLGDIPADAELARLRQQYEKQEVRLQNELVPLVREIDRAHAISLGKLVVDLTKAGLTDEALKIKKMREDFIKNRPAPKVGNLKKMPASMNSRCSKSVRLSRLKENGGIPECEEAVLKGLRWLKANQNPDGSWGAANKTAMTGLALLSYFGHCETPMSEEFGESCLKGIIYLVNFGAKKNGVLADNITGQPSPYQHGIATYALGEAATFCKELKIEVPLLMDVTHKAGQLIIDSQNKNGGWAYGYSAAAGAHTDSSVVGWQLQALKACSYTGITYMGMNHAVVKGLDYLASLQDEKGGFGYNGKSARPGLTGVGVLCFQMWGRERSPGVRNSIKYLQENTKLDWKTANSDLYGHYYISQAMMQAGGSNWTFYNKLFRDQFLSNQNPDGSWKAPAFSGHGQTPGGDPVYRNTLCILMLEVYYRFVPTFGAL